jgi:uncharacterized protein YpmS
MQFPVKSIFVLTAIMLILIGLACRLPVDLAKENISDVPIYSTEDAQAVEEILQNAQAQTGQFAFTITEEQLTSYITLKLSETQDDFTVQNAVVSLDDSLIITKADLYFTKIGLKVPAEISLSGTTTVDGELVFSLETISLGNLELPENMEKNLSMSIEEAMNSNLGTQLSGFRMDTLYIDEGMITISGSRR